MSSVHARLQDEKIHTKETKLTKNLSHWVTLRSGWI